MHELLPIIQRKRRPLQTAILPEAVPAGPPAVTVCPHCGRSLTEPASVTSVTLDPNLPATPNQSHDDAPEN